MIGTSDQSCWLVKFFFFFFLQLAGSEQNCQCTFQLEEWFLGNPHHWQDWEQCSEMFAESEDSLLRQQRSEAEDLVDDEFTPEELR